jgi:hypothetical protein
MKSYKENRMKLARKIVFGLILGCMLVFAVVGGGCKNDTVSGSSSKSSGGSSSG